MAKKNAPDAAPDAAAPTPTEKPPVLKQNGIKRPDAGTLTGRLWDIADQLSAELKRPAPRKAVIEKYMAEVAGANMATANTQYARWVTYHGATEALKAARQQEKADKLAAGEQDRAAKAEAKAKAKADKEAARAAAKEAKAKADAEAAAANPAPAPAPVAAAAKPGAKQKKAAAAA